MVVSILTGKFKESLCPKITKITATDCKSNTTLEEVFTTEARTLCLSDSKYEASVSKNEFRSLHVHKMIPVLYQCVYFCSKVIYPMNFQDYFLLIILVSLQ